jgi:hypothetical protein
MLIWLLRSFSLGLLLIAATPAHAMFSPVQRAIANSSTSGTSEPVTVLSTIEGHGAIVGLSWCNNNASCTAATTDIVTSVSDTNGDSCSEASGTFQAKNNGTLFFQTEIWVCPALSAANTTFTVTFSGTVFYPTLAVTELTPGGFVVDGSTGGGGSATATSINLVTNASTANNGEFVYGIAGVAGPATTSSKQAVLNNNSGGTIADGFQISGASGSTYTDTFTNSGSAFVTGSVVALIPPSLAKGYDYFNSLPINPLQTESTSGIMAGLFGRITPGVTGNVKITVSGDCYDAAIGNGATLAIRYGTGASPAYGAALTGTVVGATQSFLAVTIASRQDCTLNANLTGLAPGTSYWLDLGITSSLITDEFTIENVNLSAREF